MGRLFRTASSSWRRSKWNFWPISLTFRANQFKVKKQDNPRYCPVLGIAPVYNIAVSHEILLLYINSCQFGYKHWSRICTKRICIYKERKKKIKTIIFVCYRDEKVSQILCISAFFISWKRLENMSKKHLKPLLN